MVRYSGHALLLVLGALFVFHSPFTRWWAEQDLPWYTVFLLWLVLIVLVVINNSVSGSSHSGVGKNSTDKTEGDPNGD